MLKRGESTTLSCICENKTFKIIISGSKLIFICASCDKSTEVEFSPNINDVANRVSSGLANILTDRLIDIFSSKLKDKKDG